MTVRNNSCVVSSDTALVPDFYVSSRRYAKYDSWWIEGIKDGPITIEMEVVVNDGVPITIEKKAMVCTEKTKAEWQQEVWNDIELVFGIDASTFNPNNSFISNNDQLEAIYNYYGETFFRDEENYLWPGLGKLAGASVYAGLVDAEIGVGIVDFFTGYTGALNFITEPTLNEMQGILMLGADRIFSDLAWQFKAYHTSGLCAIKYVVSERKQPF